MKRVFIFFSFMMCFSIFACFSSCKKGNTANISQNTNVPVEGKNNFKISKGINISHWLSQSSVRGENRKNFFTEADVKYLAELGFDHLRIPIDEEQMFTEEGKKEVEAFTLLHNALKWCYKYNLRAIVDLHILRSHYFNDKDNPLFTDRNEQLKFFELWKQLCSELKSYSVDYVAYELMNEPVADNPEIWNVLVNECAQIVRELEPERTIVIGSNSWQGYQTVKDLRIPENDPNIIISFHYYNPFLLTHYAASWIDNLKNYKGPVHYPGKLITDEEFAGFSNEDKVTYGEWNKQTYDINVIESNFREVVKIAEKYNVSAYCGEYGCITAAPREDKLRWFDDVNKLFDKYNIARSSWDYKGGFGIIVNGVEQREMIDILVR